MGAAANKSGADAFPRVLSLYGGLFLAFGVASPFLAPFLAGKGLSAEAIGLALAGGTGIRILTGPAGGRAADRLCAPQATLAVCTGCTAFIGWLHIPVVSDSAATHCGR